MKIVAATFFIFVAFAEPKGASEMKEPVIKGNPAKCKDPAKCDKGNVVAGSEGAKKIPELSDKELRENNETAAKYIKTDSQIQNEKLKKALRATVQTIPKCALGINGNGFKIDSRPSEFCSGHPLAKYGGFPRPPPGLETLADKQGHKPKPCGIKPCSGALVGGQDTVTTAGHCLGNMSPKEFCEEYVFVFNRAEDKKDFSSDEVAECDAGTSVDQVSGTKDFNLGAISKTKDHAVFKLKKPVPESTATALEIRKTEVNSQEPLYAVGHPHGTSRKISPLTNPHKTQNSANYDYMHGTGYAYPGNSGGPMLDSNGQVVGIVAAVDDRPAGPPKVREPKVKNADTKEECKTQIAEEPLIVEAVTYGAEVKKALNDLRTSGTGTPAKEETVVPDNLK